MSMSRGEADGKPFEDTQKRGKPIVFIYGSRPFTAALCLGVEKGMKGMKAGEFQSLKPIMGMQNNKNNE
jgi:FKBP-type peptidyl-prolyl cis-trans isomerase